MFIDLLLLLLLSFFLGSQLWKVLGRNFKDSKAKRPSLFVLPKEQVVVQKEPLPDTSFYPGFNESLFLEGAEKAFEQIVSAFHRGDHKTLEKRVAPHLLASFSHKSTPPHESLQVCLLSSTILSRSLKGDTASIAVQFTSQQTTGPSIHTVEEVWIFSRSIASKDPNWVLEQVGETSKTPQ